MRNMTQLLNGYRLSIAQQHWALTNLRAAAERHLHAPSLAAIHHALPQVVRGNEIEQAYEAARGRQADAHDARDLDLRIGRFLAAVHGTLAGLAALGRDDALGRFADDLLVATFPDGLGAHVRCAFKEKARRNTNLVARIRAAVRMGDANTGFLLPLATGIETLNAAFREVLAYEPGVTYPEVAAARGSGQEATLRAVCTIFASFEPKDAPTRDAILAPWFALQEEIGAEKRRGRSLAAPSTSVLTPPNHPTPEAPVTSGNGIDVTMPSLVEFEDDTNTLEHPRP